MPAGPGRARRSRCWDVALQAGERVQGDAGVAEPVVGAQPREGLDGGRGRRRCQCRRGGRCRSCLRRPWCPRRVRVCCGAWPRRSSEVGGGEGREGTDVGAGGDRSAKSGDLFVLGGKPGQGQGFELSQLGDGVVAAGNAVGEVGDRVFERGQLSLVGVQGLSGGAEVAQASLELLAQPGVGAGAVEGGAVDAGQARQGGDVTVAVGGDVPASSRSIAARIRVSLVCRWDAVIRMSLLTCSGSRRRWP